MRLISDCAEATEELGRRIARDSEPGDLLLLEGDLAAGKTTFVRGFVDGLGGDPAEVSSPTFVVIQSYECPGPEIRIVHHVDLYRLDDDQDELRETGLEELLSDPNCVVAIEWPKTTVLEWLPTGARSRRIRFQLLGDGCHKISIESP